MERSGIKVYLESLSVCPIVGVYLSYLDQKGGSNTLAGEVVGGPNSDDWIESLALCILCGME
jgi:hypothetical protein